ncbi:MAG TPA: NAD(P)H-dependent oxidoreductase [Ktedonobacterales bacterium]|jgi:NAD(P)H-dependent FMN reductase|nr:NAD(P)H-dependent oxidoreductase [Ktedonobacterales bacterium]
MAPRIMIIVGSTRQNRQGEAVARWIARRAAQRPGASFERADLKDWPLPFLDSPMPPAFGQYDEATRPWAEEVGSADGYIFVTPEYSHGYPQCLGMRSTTSTMNGDTSPRR